MSTLRSILLHHTPDPESEESGTLPPHYDWMVEIRHSEPGIRDVPTWRTPIRVDAFTPGQGGPLTRIGDHRTDWLASREAVRLDGGRGLVTPVAHGSVTMLTTSPTTWLVEVDWDSTGPARYRIEQPDASDGHLERLHTLEDDS